MPQCGSLLGRLTPELLLVSCHVMASSFLWRELWDLLLRSSRVQGAALSGGPQASQYQP